MCAAFREVCVRDDRSFSSPTPEGVLAQKAFWAGWSEKVGYVENGLLLPRRPALVSSLWLTRMPAKSPRNWKFWEFQLLCNLEPRQVKKNENQRLKVRWFVSNCLAALKLGFAKFHRAAPSYAFSKCVYGWPIRTPTLAIRKKWALRRGQRSLFAASPVLPGVMMGGLSHIDCVVAVNLLRVVQGFLWDCKRGSPVFALKIWLRDRGWQFTSDWI